MKLAEMNERQKKAFFNIYYAANWIIGGLENTIADEMEGSEDYEECKKILADHNGLVEAIYNASTTKIYNKGRCSFGNNDAKELKDIRFCGKEFLMARCEARVKTMGY